MFVIEAIFYYEREDLVKLFNGGAELEKDGGWVLVNVRWDVYSSGNGVGNRRRWCCRGGGAERNGSEEL